MNKFRSIMEKRIKDIEEGNVKVVLIGEAEEILEKHDIKINPIDVLREKGFVIKSNLPSKNGRELTFFKANVAEEAYELLIDLGYEKQYKINFASKIVSITNK